MTHYCHVTSVEALPCVAALHLSQFPGEVWVRERGYTSSSPNALQPVERATTIRVRNGKPSGLLLIEARI